MASFSALDILKTAPRKPIEELFDSMWMPHWTNYLTQSDVENLRRIATSKKYAGNMDLKYRMIDNIMKSRGFRRFAGGTNRLVFAHYEDPTILAKVAVDKVGMTDNPYEYKAQVLLKPYCTKMLQVTDCGTVGFAERVLPVTSVKEFKLIAGDVFDIIMNKIIGKYIMEDIGTEFYMNWGIRKGFGPVLLDYPYVFETEGAKLYCQNVLPNGMICNHEIDYDSGFNKLVCTGCGKIYTASDLKKDRAMNNIVIVKGGSKPMNVKIIKGGQVVSQNYSSDTIKKPDNRATSRKPVSDKWMKVSIVKGGKTYVMLKDGHVFGKEEPGEEKNGYVKTETVLETEEQEIDEKDSSSAESEGQKAEAGAIPGEGYREDHRSNEVGEEIQAMEKAEETSDKEVQSDNVPKVSTSEASHEESTGEKTGGKFSESSYEILSSSSSAGIKYGLKSNTKKIPIGSPFIDSAGEY